MASKQQQLDAAVNLWIMYTSGAMRATTAQVWRLEAKIQRLRRKIAKEQEAQPHAAKHD